MALLDSIKKSVLGLQGKSQKAYSRENAKLQKDYAKASLLDQPKEPLKYDDNKPN